ncbi:MAG: bifunctional oligoribonuclease/PAP phosphatase NrnA [Candidatus Omnitrophota bacterium]
MSLKNAVEAIRKNKSFLITAHTNPEGDALGSELAFYLLLRKLGKEAVIVNEDKALYGYEFLPGINNIKRYKNENQKFNFDCFVTLDSSDLKRTGEVYRLNRDHKPVLNIDHHISNTKFGEVNWVEPGASSCSEMVYRIYKKMKVGIGEDAALALYTGILTDTGSFRYSNTSVFTHHAVAELLKYGIDVPEVYRYAYENIPFEDIKLLIKILLKINRSADGKLIWFQVPHNLLKRKKVSFDLAEHLLTFGRSIKGVRVVALFKENSGVKNEIRVNLRSQGKVDVNEIASYFGGGGHKAAAGITIRGKIDNVRRRVLAKIKEAL